MPQALSGGQLGFYSLSRLRERAGVRVGPFRQNAPIYKTFNSKEYCQDLVGMDTSLSPTLSRKREKESNPHQYALCLNRRCVENHPAQAPIAR